MAYQSNWTGAQIDDSIDKTSRGPAFIKTGIINVYNQSIQGTGITSQQLYDYVNTGITLLSGSNEAAAIYLQVLDEDPSIGSSPSLVYASIFKTHITDHGQSYYILSLEFKLNGYNYSIHTRNYGLHTDWSSWSIEKSTGLNTVDYPSFNNKFLISLAEELSIPNPSSTALKNLITILKENPFIIVNDTSDTYHGVKIRMSVLGYDSYSYNDGEQDHEVERFLVSYSKATYISDNTPHFIYDQVGFCELVLDYTGDYSLNSLKANYLPTLGFE